jgi:hypothetical protein
MFAISIAAAADTQIELDGLEKVENRDAYKLILTMKDGHSIHVSKPEVQTALARH